MIMKNNYIKRNERTVDSCFICPCYDEDYGCTMPSIDMQYACSLFADMDEDYADWPED